MRRNLKALGLALAAVLAMSAVAAVTVGAENGEKADFSAASYPATIDATGEGVHTFKIPGFPTWTCGDAETPAVHATATLAEESETITAEFNSYEEGTNAYTKCHIVAIVTFPITVHMNGCHYDFIAGTFTKAANKSDGSFEIQCPEGKEITITIFKAGTSEHTDANRRCTIHIPPQKAVGSVTFNNIETAGGLMAVTGHAEEVKVTATVTNAENAVCPEHIHTTEFVYKGDFVAQATNEAKEYIDTTVTGTAP